MRILITGSKGQLGSELARQLAAGGSGLGELPAQYRDAYVVGVDIEDFDLGDKQAVLDHVRGGSFDLVINCAAMTNVDGCEAAPDAAYKANAIAARNMAMVCEQTATKLVHLSTDYVFAGDAAEPYREYDLPAPKSVYGKTKLAGEQFVRERCYRYFIVRTQWLYGQGGNFVRTILKAARERGELKVVNDQFGCPTSAEDLAYHILKIALDNRYGIYHCVNHGVTSWFEFAREIVRLAGVDAEVRPCETFEFSRPAPRPAYSALDNMMLRLTVGDGMRDWRDALAPYVRGI
jgi:dTDP-4-dehydrorhamnose reductase